MKSKNIIDSVVKKILLEQEIPPGSEWTKIGPSAKADYESKGCTVKIGSDGKTYYKTSSCTPIPVTTVDPKEIKSYPSCVQGFKIETIGNLVFIRGEGDYKGYKFFNNNNYYNDNNSKKGKYDCDGNTIRIDPTTPITTVTPTPFTWTEITKTGDDILNGFLVKKGMKGDIVSEIQKNLIKHGFKFISKDGSADGKFGQRTKSSVIEFQTKNNLNDDGTVGPYTWAKLVKEPEEIKPEEIKPDVEPKPEEKPLPFDNEALPNVNMESKFKVMGKKVLIEDIEKTRILELHNKYKNFLNDVILEQVTPSAPVAPVKQKTSQDAKNFFRLAQSSGCLTDTNLKYDEVLQTKDGKFYIRGWSKSKQGMVKKVYDDYTWKIVDPDDTTNIIVQGKWSCDATEQMVEKVKQQASTQASVKQKLDTNQADIIQRWKYRGYIPESEATTQQVDTYELVQVKPVGDPNFPQGLKMYYNPTIGKKESTTVIKTFDSLNTIIKDQSITKKSCRPQIEQYWKSFKQKDTLKVDPETLKTANNIIRSCKSQHYGNWGILGGGKKWDEILDVLSRKPNSSYENTRPPERNSPWLLQ